VLQDCLGAEAKFTCPANNMNSNMTPYFASPNAVKCKPCSASTKITDMDARPDKFWVGLEWGPLMSTSGAFAEKYVTGYMVHIVDSKNKILQTLDPPVDKVSSSTTCCSDKLYSYSAAGTLPTGFSKFMIVPTMMVNGMEVPLPMGVLTNVFDDTAQGTVTIVKGSFDLELSVSLVDLKKDKKKYRKVTEALREAIADTITGVDKNMIRITGLSAGANTTRRLREEPKARSLAGKGKVKVSYEILIPESAGDIGFSKSSIDPAKLKKAINTRVAAKGIVGVSVTGDIVVAEPDVETEGAPMQTGGAHRKAPANLLATLLAVLGALYMIH